MLSKTDRRESNQLPITNSALERLEQTIMENSTSSTVEGLFVEKKEIKKFSLVKKLIYKFCGLASVKRFHKSKKIITTALNVIFH